MIYKPRYGKNYVIDSYDKTGYRDIRDMYKSIRDMLLDDKSSKGDIYRCFKLYDTLCGNGVISGYELREMKKLHPDLFKYFIIYEKRT